MADDWGQWLSRITASAGVLCAQLAQRPLQDLCAVLRGWLRDELHMWQAQLGLTCEQLAAIAAEAFLGRQRAGWIGVQQPVVQPLSAALEDVIGDSFGIMQADHRDLPLTEQLKPYSIPHGYLRFKGKVVEVTGFFTGFLRLHIPDPAAPSTSQPAHGQPPRPCSRILLLWDVSCQPDRWVYAGMSRPAHLYQLYHRAAQAAAPLASTSAVPPLPYLHQTAAGLSMAAALSIAAQQQLAVTEFTARGGTLARQPSAAAMEEAANWFAHRNFLRGMDAVLDATLLIMHEHNICIPDAAPKQRKLTSLLKDAVERDQPMWTHAAATTY